VLKEHGAREVYLFGSAATDKMREGSDVDLAVTGLPPERFFERCIGRTGPWVLRPWTWWTSMRRTRSRSAFASGGTSSVSSELRTKVETELTMMRRLLDAYPDLFADAAAGDPSRRDVAALASVVHSFCNGAEKVLKAVSDAFDGRRVLGPETWHSQLLDNMTRPTDRRGPVLSEPLADRLGDYMEFRHLFRHAYTLELWSKMDHLVAGIEETFRDFEGGIRAFTLVAADGRTRRPAVLNEIAGRSADDE
jgi:hypothetical protein